MNKKSLLLAAVAALALAGCASSGGTKERTTTTNQPEPPTYGSGGSAGGPTGYDSIASDSAVIGGAGSPAAAAAEAAVAAERAMLSNVIYFEFDSSQITSAGQEVVETYSSYLTSNPAAKVRVEGHADERGTREYNVTLAEQRARVVQSALLAKGVSQGQLTVTSYGEERPADPGHSEEAWAKNRRVQLIRQ